MTKTRITDDFKHFFISIKKMLNANSNNVSILLRKLLLNKIVETK